MKKNRGKLGGITGYLKNMSDTIKQEKRMKNEYCILATVTITAVKKVPFTGTHRDCFVIFTTVGVINL
jgi:hypothetical protein